MSQIAGTVTCTMGDQHALVVGAGIGGLTTALCLARAGCTVDILEKSKSINETGAGIQLSPNATRVLHYLGLEQRLRAVSFLPLATEIRDYRSGRSIVSRPLGDAVVSRYGFPYYHVHRADLVQVLHDAIKENQNIHVHTNQFVNRLTESNNRVSAQTDEQTFEGQFLVGADGIHSNVRTHLFGSEAPRFTGNIAWRALVPASRIEISRVRPVSTAWLGPGAHFVHYYVRGGELINCVCVVEKTGWQHESWTELGDHAELKRDFSAWHPDVRALIDAMDPSACYKWALFDRPPMPRWSVGNMTLLGDACHATLPFMAQGAAMAIEDAAVLADCVKNGLNSGRRGVTGIADSLQQYESRRHGRTRKIQLGSRRNARLFHAAGMRAWIRNRIMKQGSSVVTHQLFNYNALNHK